MEYKINMSVPNVQMWHFKSFAGKYGLLISFPMC